MGYTLIVNKFSGTHLKQNSWPRASPCRESHAGTLYNTQAYVILIYIPESMNIPTWSGKNGVLDTLFLNRLTVAINLKIKIK
jgi:hypothetical protein